VKEYGKTIALMLMIALAAGAALALNPGTDLYVPAAARVTGVQNGVTLNWKTDLYIFNPGTAAVSVDVYWLPRDTDNSTALPKTFTVNPQQTLVLDDVIFKTFGVTDGGGAFRVTSNAEVIVNSRIYNTITDDPAVDPSRFGTTFGQGLEGVPASAAVSAGESTDIVGLANNGATGQPGTFRSNVFAVSTSTQTTHIVFSLLDPAGVQIATRAWDLPPRAAFYAKASDLGGPNFDDGTLHVAVTSGSAIVIGSKNDNGFSDGTTLEGAWELGAGAGGGDGIYTGFVQYDTGDPQTNLPDNGGITIQVQNGQIIFMQGTLILFSPDDGGTNCGNIFPWGTDNTDFQPVAFDGQGNFQVQFTDANFTNGTSITFNLAGNRDGDTITATLNVTVTNPDPAQCNGTMIPAGVFAGHTNLVLQ
jgi:hypothetical protein